MNQTAAKARKSPPAAKARKSPPAAKARIDQTAAKPRTDRPAAGKRKRAAKPRSAALLTPVHVIDRLAAEAPLTPRRPHGDPIVELVLTLLSQNTSDHNSGRAFQRLIDTFPTWDAAIAAPLQAVEDAIRIGGLAKTKAPRLQALLRSLRDRLGDNWDPAPLSAMSIPEAKDWLTSLPGIGPKTAACVLLFSLGRPALPVDTHVHRVSQRLGLIGPKVNPVAAHDALEAQMPPPHYYDYHVAVIRHGRRVCKAQRPRCDACVLADGCPSAFTFADLATPSPTQKRAPR